MSENVDSTRLFDKASVGVMYVQKDELKFPVLFPSHKGEEDWLELPYDSKFDYNNKIYNLETKKWDDWFDYAKIAKAYVAELVESNLEYLGEVWQVDAVKSEPAITSEITTAQYAELPDSFEVDWILANNEVQSVTIGQLKGLLVAKATRRTAIYKAYTTWRSGDQKTEFVFE